MSFAKERKYAMTSASRQSVIVAFMRRRYLGSVFFIRATSYAFPHRVASTEVTRSFFGIWRPSQP
jgi:hypothetical protein